MTVAPLHPIKVAVLVSVIPLCQCCLDLFRYVGYQLRGIDSSKSFVVLIEADDGLYQFVVHLESRRYDLRRIVFALYQLYATCVACVRNVRRLLNQVVNLFARRALSSGCESGNDI